MKVIKVDAVKTADSFMKRLRGYMFQKLPSENEVLIIKPCNQVHTFNMKFELDILFMDDSNLVLQKNTAVKPGKILPKVENANFVVEAKAGVLHGVEENERIRFELYN